MTSNKMNIGSTKCGLTVATRQEDFPMASLSCGSYGVAYGLKGFSRKGTTTHLRVKIERIEGDYVWVRTASLQDAGTPLVLNVSQVVPEEEF